MVIARLKSHNRVRELLSEVGLKASTIDAEACVRHAVEVASGEREPLAHHEFTEPFVPVESEPVVLIQTAELSDRSASVEASALPEEEEPLSNEERRQGALIGRVEMRVAGATRKGPRKIMPSPEDSGRFLLAQRNPKTGELEPLERQGAVRPVNRDIDGVWREF